MAGPNLARVTGCHVSSIALPGLEFSLTQGYLGETINKLTLPEQLLYISNNFESDIRTCPSYHRF